jgi:hypothetical protein
MGGFRLPLKVFSKTIRNEEVVDSSLVGGQILSVRPDGSIEVVLELNVLAMGNFQL